MPTQEIARDQWREFCDSFSHQHEGWLVTVELFGPDLGALVEAQALPFAGITLEPDGEAETKIEILAGNRPDAHIVHTITAPQFMWLKQTEEGADEALEIKSEDRAALLRFRPAVRSELVDGIH